MKLTLHFEHDLKKNVNISAREKGEKPGREGSKISYIVLEKTIRCQKTDQLTSCPLSIHPRISSMAAGSSSLIECGVLGFFEKVNL